MSEDKTYKEVELLVEFEGADINAQLFEPADEATRELVAHYAEVNIPYHTDTEIYCFTCYLVGVPHARPAITEMLSLNTISEQLHRDFGQYAKTPEWMLAGDEATEEE